MAKDKLSSSQVEHDINQSLAEIKRKTLESDDINQILSKVENKLKNGNDLDEVEEHNESARKDDFFILKR